MSEKFFDPLIAGSVPVYLGCHDIETFAPQDRCFVNVNDFSGPRKLAEYLEHLAEDSVRYESYLAWKTRPFRQGFVDVVETQRLDYRCRLCRCLERLLQEEL